MSGDQFSRIPEQLERLIAEVATLALLQGTQHNELLEKLDEMHLAVEACLTALRTRLEALRPVPATQPPDEGQTPSTADPSSRETGV